MNQSLILATTSALVLGSTISAFVTHKVMKTKFEELLDKEIAEAKIYYSKLYKTDEWSDPEVLAAKYLEEQTANDEEDIDHEAIADKAETIMSNYSSKFKKGASDANNPERAEIIVKNIFDRESIGEFNYDHEVKQRSRNAPYIITHVEFMQSELEFDQDTLTYFVQDKVLSESNDEYVRDVDEVVGIANLERFGHGSDDINVVYIRNEKTRMEYEILRSDGSYAKEVHGIDPD